MQMTAYCTFEFLDNLLSGEGIDYFAENGISTQKNKLEVQELLLSGAKIKMNISDAEISAKFKNPYLLALIKRNRVNSAIGDFNQLATDETEFFRAIPEKYPLLFLHQVASTRLTRYQDNYGVHCLSNESDYSSIFDEQLQNFKASKNSTDWGFAVPFLSPHHSILVAAPHMFTTETLDSLLTLLTKSAPRDLKRTYHITLIGKSRFSGSQDENFYINNYLRKKQELLNSLKEIHVEMEYHFYNGPEFHDRYIITNNSYVFSGNGLDFIKGGITKKDGIWFGIKPFKRTTIDGEKGVYFVNLMNEKLAMMKNWVSRSSNKSSNPLLQ